MQKDLNVVSAADALEEFGKELEIGELAPDFRQRVSIERALFVGCKSIAAECVGYDLHGFSLDDRLGIEEALAQRAVAPLVADLLRRGFELRAALPTLMSGNPYIAGDVLLEFDHSRKEALRSYGAKLAKFVERLRSTYSGLAEASTGSKSNHAPKRTADAARLA